MFTAGGKTLLNNDWKRHNVKKLEQIVELGKIMNFNHVKDKYNLNQSCFLQYLQLKTI